MSALRSIFRRVWEQRKAASGVDSDALVSELKRLEQRKERILSEMAGGRVSGDDFSRMYYPLKVEIANVQERLSQASADEIDVDTALSYLESCFWNTSSLWQAEDLDGKQRLQKLIFPAGIVWEKDGFGTPKTHSIFTLFAGFASPESDDATLVAPRDSLILKNQ